MEDVQLEVPEHPHSPFILMVLMDICWCIKVFGIVLDLLFLFACEWREEEGGTKVLICFEAGYH